MVKALKWILSKVNGKKTSIVAIIMTTTAFLALKAIIDLDTQLYIDTVVLISAFGANYANAKIA